MNATKKIKYEIKYLISKIKLLGKKLNVKILSNEETLDQISERRSIIRFGDGEFSLIGGRSNLFEEYSPDLKDDLIRCLESLNNDNLLLCLPEILVDRKKFVKRSVKNWVINLSDNFREYKLFCKEDYTYGNAFVSRPYLSYRDKSKTGDYFEKFKNIFDNQDIFLIEGSLSRIGVGNDLFDGAHSIHRIICPSRDAYLKLEKIKKACYHIPKDALVLIALGPAAKPLALHLIEKGHWVLDIGHIDSEYEWFLAKSTNKKANGLKHFAECPDDEVLDCDDEKYLNSIIEIIK